MQPSPATDARRGHPAVPPVSPLAAEVADLDGGCGAVADDLLRRHVADRLGHCRGCALPQAGPTRWPCTLWQVATVARAAVRRRRLPPSGVAAPPVRAGAVDLRRGGR